MNLPKLERERLAAAANRSATRRAYDAALRDAKTRGVASEADIVVRLLVRNLETALSKHGAAVGAHHAALRS